MAKKSVNADEIEELEGSRAPLLDHLNELRDRLISCVIALVIGMGVSYVFAAQIFAFLLQPFKWAVISTKGPKALEGLHFVYSGLEQFMVNVKIAAFGGICLAFPVIAFQIYRFVAPGLYKHERGAFVPFLVAAPILFIAGASLVYFIVLQMVLKFALSLESNLGGISVEMLPRVDDYLSLTTTLIVAFGISFQLPLLLVLLGKAGFLRAEQLREGRRFAILGIVIFAAIVTPPDVLSQLALAVPMCLLYEGSIFVVRLNEKAAERKAAAAEKAAAMAEDGLLDTTPSAPASGGGAVP